MRTDAQKRDSGDYFRLLADVSEPDPRWRGLVRIDTHPPRPATLTERHAALSELTLCDAVPDELTVQFDTARNLLLYSWHVYRFIPVAELQAYRTVEMALRLRFAIGPATESKRHKQKRKQPPKLSELLNRAVSEGLLRDEGFRQHRRIREWQQFYKEEMQAAGLDGDPIEVRTDLQTYVKALTDTIPTLRNDLAHGSCTLHAGGLLTVEICCDLINQLFSSGADRRT